MTGKYSYNILSQLKPTFKVASISTGLMNNSQLKATLEWAISHPFSILMWCKQTEFQDFWDQSWRFLLSNIRAFIFVLWWVNHWFDWKLSNLSTVSKVCQALHINLEQKQDWHLKRSRSWWYHLTFTGIEGVESDFCRACARLTFRNRIFVFLVFEVLQQSAYLALFCWWELNSALGCQPPHMLSFEAQSWFEAQSSPLLFLISPIHRVIYC